jgi:membrane protease YdiL (CAAX protease family)
MDTIKIRTLPFFLAICAVCIVEIAAYKIFTPSLVATGITRCTEIALILFIIFQFYKGASPLGLTRDQILPGLSKGLIWSAGFGAVSAFTGLFLLFFDINPIQLIHVSLPDTLSQMVLFYLVGGVIAPISEEIFFRGIIYGYFRGLLYDRAKLGGVFIALTISTFLFVIAHRSGGGIPLPQLVGGIVFCVSYEIEKKLATPILIHSLGNIALFTISIV